MTRPTIHLTPMSEAPKHKPDWFWLAPVVCFLSIAAPLLLKL